MKNSLFLFSVSVHCLSLLSPLSLSLSLSLFLSLSHFSSTERRCSTDDDDDVYLTHFHRLQYFLQPFLTGWSVDRLSAGLSSCVKRHTPFYGNGAGNAP